MLFALFIVRIILRTFCEKATYFFHICGKLSVIHLRIGLFYYDRNIRNNLSKDRLDGMLVIDNEELNGYIVEG